MIKIRFKLPKEASFNSEGLWAMEIKKDQYELHSSPWYVYGISYGDIVSAKEYDDALFFDSIIKKSGNSTFRILKSDNSSSSDFWDFIEKRILKFATYDGASENFLALNVDKGGDLKNFRRLLEEGENLGLFDWEDADAPDLT